MPAAAKRWVLWRNVETPADLYSPPELMPTQLPLLGPSLMLNSHEGLSWAESNQSHRQRRVGSG